MRLTAKIYWPLTKASDIERKLAYIIAVRQESCSCNKNGSDMSLAKRSFIDISKDEPSTKVWVLFVSVIAR
jgi:hypothetical protein